MRALVKKELGRLLPAAVVVSLILTAFYASVFDVEGALLAPPSDLLLVVLLLSVNLGALAGYGQLANERHAGTLSLLLQRDMAPGALIAAKCAAAWTGLALAVHVPVVLFALWERSVSPLAPVLQIGRVGELLLLGAICVPGHALGLFCATLPVPTRLQAVLLPLAAQGLVLLAFMFLAFPIAGRWGSSALFLLGASGLSAWLLAVTRARLTLLDDGERSEPRRPGSRAGWLMLLALEPGASRATAARAVPRDVRLVSQGTALG